MTTDGSVVDISGDVDYFQYSSIGLDDIHPRLCFLKIFEISSKFRKWSIQYFRVTQALQSMTTDGSGVDISGDVDYFQYSSIGLDDIHPKLCFLKIFEISSKFRKNRQFDISEWHRRFNR